ncbi:hypothetical protein JHK87_003270 [Glycine soja]|nr:hypothetical protein JHK87_003270 [Glycine soja]
MYEYSYISNTLLIPIIFFPISLLSFFLSLMQCLECNEFLFCHIWRENKGKHVQVSKDEK